MLEPSKVYNEHTERLSERRDHALHNILPAVGLIALLTMSTIAQDAMSGVRTSARLIASGSKLQLSLTPMFANHASRPSWENHKISPFDFPDELFEPDHAEHFFE